MPKDSFYFDHDYKARNDDKILELRSTYGAEGYGIFWMILETMAENEDGGLKASLIGGLSLGFSIPKETLLAIIALCVRIDLFYEKDNYIFSRRLLKHKNYRKSLSDAGKRGADAKKKNSPPEATLQAPLKLYKGKERKEEENNNEANLPSEYKTVSKSIGGLGEIQVRVFAGCKPWELSQIEKFITGSQKEFEAISMNKPPLKSIENFILVLQDFVNMFQEKGDYQEHVSIRKYFINWLNKKNGTLDTYIADLKANSGEKPEKKMVL